MPLLDLPTEIIISIAEQTDRVKDVLNLRLGNTMLARICDFPLQRRKRRLFLHPSRLEDVVRFCGDEGNKWKQGIEEICLLAGWERGEESCTEGALAALEKLGKLRALRFLRSTEDDRMGFCGVERAGSDENGDGDKAVFCTLLRSREWDSVNIDYPLAGRAGSVPQLCSVKALEIAIPGHDGWSEWVLDLINHLPSLEKLTLSIASAQEEQAVRQLRNLPPLQPEPAWEEDTTHRRRCFLVSLGEILGRTAKLHECHLLSTARIPARLSPAMLASLLQPSAPTLRQINMDMLALVPETAMYPSAGDWQRGLREGLALLSSDPFSLERASYRVDIFHALVRREDGFDRGKGLCESYKMVKGGDVGALLVHHARILRDAVDEVSGWEVVSAPDIGGGRAVEVAMRREREGGS